MTIVEFIKARLREERLRAELAQQQRWDHPADAPWTRERLTIERQGFSTPAQQMIATFADPARVLREVEAKRRIVDLHQPDGVLENWYWSNRRCAHCGKHWHTVIPGRLPTEIGPEVGCPTLRLLALPYADHPQYEESWRP